MSAIRLMPGAISLRSSISLELIDDSKLVNPVMLPPGSAKPAMKPLPIGSETWMNTMGMVRVCCWSAATTGVVWATIRSGCSSTSSRAKLRIRSLSPAPQR
jgi:hypothetical protein